MSIQRDFFSIPENIFILWQLLGQENEKKKEKGNKGIINIYCFLKINGYVNILMNLVF